MNIDIEKALDDYDFARLGICAYFNIQGYPILFTDVYWRIKSLAKGRLELVEYDDDKPIGNPNDKYYLKYEQAFDKRNEVGEYTAIQLCEEGWAIFDNKKKVT